MIIIPLFLENNKIKAKQVTVINNFYEHNKYF